MYNNIDSITISDVISILESNLPESEQEMRLSALSADVGEICEFYEAAASYYLKANRKPESFKSLLKAAQKAQQTYRYNRAFELYTEALELLEELPDKYYQRVFRIEESLGDVSMQLAKYELAVNHYMSALKAAPSEEKQSVYYRKLGEVYDKRADYERALDYLKKGLNLLSDAPSPEHAKIYNAIGVLHLHYYRVNVVPITLPPLRERKEDIPLLAEHFIEKYSEKYAKTSNPAIADETLELLMQHSWPGNIRELENVIQVAVLMTNSDVILPEHLPEMLRPEKKIEQFDVSAGMTIEEMEERLIIKTLQHTDHNVTKSAKMLGISRRTLQNKIKKYQIPRP